MNETDKNHFDFSPFLLLRRHLKIAHHIPGRLRLRVGASVFKELGTVDIGLFDRILGAIEGIQDVRVNAAAGSVVIQYSTKEIEPDWWDTLVHGEERKADDLLNRLVAGKFSAAMQAAQGT